MTRVVGSAFGLGYLPIAPGTWGTAGTIVVAWLIPAGPDQAIWQVGTMLLFLAACAGTIILGTHAERMAGRMDPGFIVLDEVAGTLVALASFTKPALWWFVGAFFLFRVFDVLKPWPCRRFERMPGGYGILMDDLMAGFYAGLVLMIARAAIPGLS